MGLDVPDLDDRTFEELFEDARKHIPVHAEEWTDHNAHDPGITLLELLAWLAESYGYQLDQVTDAHRRKYLDLAGVEPRGPSPATVELSLSNLEEFDGHPLPARTPLSVEPEDGTVVRFETAGDATLTRARVAAVVSEHSHGRTDHTAANESPGLHYRAFGADARPSSVLYVGLDADPFESADRLALAVDFHEEGLPEPAEHGEEEHAFEPSLEVAWQHCTEPKRWYSDDAWADVPVEADETNGFYEGGRVVLAVPEKWRDEPAAILGRKQALHWLRCTPRRRRERASENGHGRARAATDGGNTAASYEVPPQFDAIRTNVVDAIHRECVSEEYLTHAGEATATTARPDQQVSFGTAPVHDAEIYVGDLRWYLVEDFDASGPDDRHCVLDESAGVVRFGDGRQGALPPADVSVVAREVVSGGSAEPVAEERLGRIESVAATTARPDQRFEFANAPVQAAEISVGGERWKQVEDFDASGPDDRHWVLEQSAGVVRFGDGRRGTIPPAGAYVEAREIVYGGGTVGNVPPGSDWRFADDALDGIDVAPLAPPTDGRDAEPIDDAFARLAAERRVPYRAVTAEDFREIALRTPGLRFGRAAAVVDAAEGPDDASSVTVVAVPYSPPGSRPVPTPGFLDAVERHLCEHVLLTDRVSVVAPTYVGVDLTAEISVSPGFAPEEMQRTAEERLESFLDPLRGFEGDGWPFGRPVHVSEVYEELEEIAGIDDVADVSVALRGDVDLGLDGTALPYPANVTVAVYSEGERCGRGF